MEELIKELIEKADLTEEQAKKATSTMMNFVKSKLPEGFSDYFDNLLSGDIDLGGLFGGSGDKSDSSSLDALQNMFGDKDDD